MKSLEQIRAGHALDFWRPAREKLEQATKAEKTNDMATAGRLRREVDEEFGGAVVSKLPSMILGNGLLATLAFAKSKGRGHEKVMLGVIAHLPAEGISAMPAPERRGTADAPLDPAIRVLTERSSLVLQRATTEALAYLGFLKRFAP